MQTFTAEKTLAENPDFEQQRAEAHHQLQDLIEAQEIDPPLVPLLSRFMAVPHCFTIQSCYGHFVHQREPDIKNTTRLGPYAESITCVEYRLAYMAFVVRNASAGQSFLRDLRGMPALDRDYVQFGCAEWFWARQVNSYVVQIEPAWGRDKDSLEVDISVALRLEDIRDRFFDQLHDIAQRHIETGPC
jgi:hypothetical protein